MKIFTCFLGCLTLVVANVVMPEVRLDENSPDTRDKILFRDDDNGELRVMDLKDTRLERKPTLKDLTFYFSTRRTVEPIVIKNNDITPLSDPGVFNPNNPIVVLIHGWLNSHSSPVNTLVSKAILETRDVNIFIADWEELANKNYFTSRFAVSKIGKFVGNFIDDLVSAFDISYKNITIIGHSLGAHIAGIAGSSVATHVDCIIGLDPAFPLFTLSDDHLDSTDADFVAIIHTSGGTLAFSTPLGHADYYPNGGELQAGCGIDVSCCHSRSYMYYAESITEISREFKAYRCDSYHDYKRGKCNTEQNVSIMGDLPIDKNANGTYYLKTHSRAPFAEDYCEPTTVSRESV